MILYYHQPTDNTKRYSKLNRLCLSLGIFITLFVTVLVLTSAGQAGAQCRLLDENFSTNPVLSPTNVDGAWYPDRYQPAGFTADAGRLKISISASDGAQLRPSGFGGSFYNTQGRKFNQCNKCVTVAKGKLYIPSDWATNFRRSDMWATALDVSDAVAFYTIIGFRNVTGSNPQMSYWNGTGWTELGAPAAYDTWYTLEARIVGANIEYLIDNVLVGTVSSGGGIYYSDVIMQAYNFNDNTLGASYDPGPNNSYDAFWDDLETTGPNGKVVTNSNTGLKYCTIQAAVNAASAGNTLVVSSGTYNERVVIDKSLTLDGNGEANTIISGTGLSGTGKGITINNGVTGVTISDLTVQNFAGSSGNADAGIYAIGGNNNLTVEHVTIQNNVGGSGFYANGPVNNVVLDYVTSSGHTVGARGIVIWNGFKENITITNCTVFNNNCCGIELQDGSASGVTMQNNNVYNNGDNGIGLVGLEGPGSNVVSMNTLTDNGRFGMEIKNPNGSGATSGAGSIVIENNTVTRTVAIVDARDIVGIAAFRRGVTGSNVDVPTGVVIQNNTVSGYTQPSTSEGFGIVVEGTNHTVTGNNVSGCDVGIQRQAGHTPYPGDGDQSNLADTYFGRGNSPVACGITVAPNTLSNTVNTRDVPASIANGGSVYNTTTGEYFCSIQTAINDAQTLSGHILEISSGNFNEQVLVTKGVTLKGVGVTQPVLDFTGTVSGKPTLIDVSADGVTIENIHFNVDLSKLRSAIIASAAGLDNITIKDNVIDNYGTAAGSYGDRNAVSVNYGGTTNYRVATGGVNNITFTGNTVNASMTGAFRSGISADEAGGTFSNNTLQTVNHDILVRFASNGNITVSNNNLNGGGVELAEHNAGAGTITVSGNTFDATLSNSIVTPRTAVLRLKNNQNNKTTVVSSNTFNNHLWAVSLENYPAATLSGNTFTPLANSTDFVHVGVNTKSLSSNSNTIVQTTVNGTFTSNVFNGSGMNGGTGIGFYNHDSDNASFGTFTIGTSGNENEFNAGITQFIRLDNQTGTTTGATVPTTYPGTGGWPTTMACWNQNYDIRNNKFDVGSGLQLPLAMNFAARTALETKLFHKPDASCTGSLLYFLPVHNLTQNTFYSTIQSAVTAANSGDVIECAEYTYNERVTIDKTLTLQGVDETNCVLDGTGLSGTGKGITINNGVTGVTIEKLTVRNYSGSSGNADAGIYAIGGNNNLTVEHVTIQNNVGGSGFYANGPVNNVVLDYVTSSGHTVGARGIVIWNGFKENITITNCTVFNNNCCGIELQDGSASGVTMQNNNVYNNGDNGIGLVGLEGPGSNVVSMNTLTNNGRFGMEIKNPNGSGATSGAGSIVVENNTVTRTVAIVDARDIVGIAAFRRGVTGSNVDVPTGVVIQNNTVSGYTQSSNSDGFGIVVEGTNHTVTGNNVSGCDVGIQRQAGHTPYPGDGDQSNLADTYFGRGNSPVACGITVASNTLSNTVNTRDVPASIASGGSVYNTTTGEYFCSIQTAIDDAQTLNGHTLKITPGSFTENVDVTSKSLTLAPGNSPGCVTINGNFTLNAGDVLDMEANSTTACTGYDQFSVFGNVTLNGATLNLTLGFVPVYGNQFTLIVNDGTDAVTGKFAQGDFIIVSGTKFFINYSGGTGNDVVLTSSCADVCSGPQVRAGATITTQSQLNAFVVSGCKPTELTSSLTLDGSSATDPITDLCNLTQLTKITGNLTIRDFNKVLNPNTLAALANLTEITGALTIGGTAAGDQNTSFTNVSLPGLTTVGGAITIGYNTAATSISLSALNSNSVASVSIQNNAAATSITCGNGFSTDASGDVNISNNAVLTSLVVNAVVVDGDAVFSNNDGTNLQVSGSLVTVNRSFAVQNCAALQSVSFPSLTLVGGPVDATNYAFDINTNGTALTTVNFPALQTIDGDLDMNNAVANLVNPSLNFNNLQLVDGNFNITRSAGGAVAFPLMTTVEGSFTFSTNGPTGAASLSVPLLSSSSVNAVVITNNPQLTSISLGNGFSTITGGDITITGNAVLNSLVLNAAVAGGIVTLDNNDGTGLAISGSLGDVAEGLSIQDCASITSVSFPSLTRVGGDPDVTPAGNLTIDENGAGVTTINLPLLVSVDGSLIMSNTLAADFVAATVNFNALTRVDAALTISHAIGGAVAFPALTTVEGGITFTFNVTANQPGMSSLNLGALNSASVDAVLVDDNDQLQTLTLGAPSGFTMISGGDIDVTDNDILTSLVVNATSAGDVNLSNNDGTNLTISGSLGQVGQTANESLTIQNNAALLSVNFPSLTTIGGAIDAVNGSLIIQANGTVLDAVNFASLQTVDGTLSMNNAAASNVSATADVSFPVLTEVDGDMTLTRAVATVTAPLLTRIGESFTVSTNSNLTTLAGFESLTTVGDVATNDAMTVTANPMLANCCIIPCKLTSIDMTSAPYTGNLTMSGNLATCNSFAAATTACSVTGLSMTVTESSGAANDNIICEGSTVTLDASASVVQGTITFEFFIDVDNSLDYNVGDVLIASINDATAPFTANTTYSAFTDGQKVMVRATNTGDGCEAYSTATTITVHDIPVASPATLTLCSTVSGGTTADFNLGDADATVNAGNAFATNISYHATQGDADNDLSPLSSPFTASNGTIIYVRVENAANTVCYSTAQVTLNVNTTPAPGTITNSPLDRLICVGGDPAGFTASAVSGVTYQWQYSQDGGTTWANATGTGGITTQNYNIPSGGIPDPEVTTMYRRQVTSTLNGCTAVSNTATVYVNTIQEGTVTANAQQLICLGGAISTIDATASVPVSGGSITSSTVTYQWQESANGTSGWANAAGMSTGEDYTPSGLTATRYYRRVVSVTLNATGTSPASVSCSVTPAAYQAMVAVNNITPGSITTSVNNAQTICTGSDPAAFVATASTLPGTPPLPASSSVTRSYKWQSRALGSSDPWVDVPSSNIEDLNLAAVVTSNTEYRRIDYSTMTLNGGPTLTCEVLATGGPATITINTVDPGTIAYDNPPAEICSGGDPANITGSVPVNPQGATISYQWQISTNGTTWSNITGATMQSYDPPSGLTADRYYRRRTRFTLNSVACDDYTNIVHVVVHPNPGAPTLVNPANLTTECTTSAVTYTFTVTPGANGDQVEWTTDPNFNNGNMSANYGIAGIGAGPFSAMLTLSPTNPTTPTTYVVRFRSKNSVTGCVGTDVTRTITIYPPATVNAGSDLVTCYNTGIQLSGSFGGGATSATWSASSAGGTFSPNNTTLNAIYTPSPSFAAAGGTITLTLTTNNPAGPCGAVNDALILTVLPKINPGVITASTPTTLCYGANPGVINSTTAGSSSAVPPATLSYIWEQSPDGMMWTTIMGETGATYDPPVLTAVTHFRRTAVVTGYVTPPTNGSSCSSVPSNVVIFNINPLPDVVDQTGEVCSDEALNITLNGSSNAVPVVNYEITSIVSNGMTASAGSPATGTGLPASVIADDAWTNTSNATQQVVYSVIGYSAAGCGDAFTVTVDVKPEPAITCPSNRVATTSENASTGDCVAELDLAHPSINGACTPVALNISFANGVPVPLSLPTGGTVSFNGTDNYTFAKGQTVVTYTATDGNSNTATCSYTVTITDDENPEVTCPADQNGSPNLSFCYTTVSGIDAVTDDNCAVASLGYSLTGATTGSGTGNASGAVFNSGATVVTYTVTDAAGLTGTCSFTVTIAPCIEISGKIVWENNPASGVKDATVDLLTTPGLMNVNTDLTDAAGDYALIAGPSGNFRIKPSKNLNLLNGVTSADATRIQQHVTNIAPLSGPYKRIAADVNKDNLISTADAQLVTQAIAGNPAALAIFNTSWRFVPSAYVFPNPNIPWGFPEYIDLTGITSSQTNQNFVGVKIGDVNGTANPLLKPGPPVLWRTSDRQLNAGDQLEVSLEIDQFDDIAACEFALGFDPSKLKFVKSASNGALALSSDNFGVFNAENGTFRFVWSNADGVTLDIGTKIFTITFEVLENGGKLSEVLFLDQQEMPARAYNSALVETGMDLVFSELVSGAVSAPEFGKGLILLQNRPNPFNETTTIGFILPETCDAQLRIFDSRGAVITEFNKTYAAGFQQEIISISRGAGIYYYELTTPFGIISKKMIRTE